MGSSNGHERTLKLVRMIGAIKGEPMWVMIPTPTVEIKEGFLEQGLELA